MSKVFATLGYTTENIGDDIQSFAAASIFSPKYIINRDNFNQVYDYETGEPTEIQESEIHLIMNGWMMHDINGYGPYSKEFTRNYQFPITNNKIKPIFISTHISPHVPYLQERKCMEYFRNNTPIYTRDLSTTKILQTHNIESEFVGCISQLLDRDSVPDNFKSEYENKIFFVDYNGNIEDRENTFIVSHYSDSLREKSIFERKKIVLNLLAKYKYAKKIVTSKLHCFLPCRAMGINVEYKGPIDERTKELVNSEPITDRLKELIKDIIK